MDSPLIELARRVVTTMVLMIAPSAALGDAATRADTALVAQHCGTDRPRFAIIGDYGTGDADARGVAQLVQAWHAEIIVTVGDNNYPVGDVDTLDKNISQFYGDYFGQVSTGKAQRFFPVLGNHDWMSPGEAGLPTPYLDFFTLPGNERYYRHVQGDVELFMLDSDSREPDGITADSVQARWLRDALSSSTAKWKWVFMHHSPYSSSVVHGSEKKLHWPFRQWGADAVFSGHSHVYERLAVDGLPYIVNGLGGAAKYSFVRHPLPESVVRFNQQHGALLACTSAHQAWLAFITVDGKVVDQFTMSKP